mmetsp:Transcript_8603/g.13220  ORF Transcript_8603/g.13220 Transcript_8603/m.13220 type:complete len:259 (-) Transcript_8603:1264-2040(-)
MTETLSDQGINHKIPEMHDDGDDEEKECRTRNCRLGKWYSHVKTIQLAHDLETVRYRDLSNNLKLATVVLQALVGSAIFSSIRGDGDLARYIRVIAGFLSVVSTVATAVKNAMNYEARWTQHEEAATAYARLRRRFDELLYIKKIPYDSAQWEDITRVWNDLEAKAPKISISTYGRAKKGMTGMSRESSAAAASACLFCGFVCCRRLTKEDIQLDPPPDCICYSRRWCFRQRTSLGNCKILPSDDTASSLICHNSSQH